jgi:tetratricopeptide (TPR) repeat protein
VQVRERLSPVAHAWESFQKWFRNLANSIADQYRDLEWKKKWMEWKSRTRHERRAHLLKLLEEGDEHRRADRYSEAEKNYVEIISLDPKNVSAYIGLAKTYFNQDKFKEAEEVARHVVESLDSASELAWAYLGRALKAQSKWDDAAVSFKHALKLNPLMAKRWIDLGDCYKEGGGLAEAIGAFRKAAEIEPNNPRVLDQLIGISIISGDKRLAREAFLQLQAVNPENQKLVDWEAQIGDM